MKIESLPTEIANTVNKVSGLKLYLNNLNKGRPATPRSWLYESESDSDVLSRWMKILESVKAMPHGELVYQFDTSQLKKFGPQGQVKPIKELMEIVTEGYDREGTPKPSIFQSKLWLQAKDIAVELLTDHGKYYKRLRPRDYAHVIDDMRDRDTLDSNSGYPDFGRRKNPEHLEKAIRDIKTGAYKDYPAIALFRNYNQKTRLVWMYPMATNIVEGSYTQPLKEMLMNGPMTFFAPWRGFDAVKKLTTQFYNAGNFISASDFSHTDAHFTKWVVLEVFDVIKYCFQEQYWQGLKESLLRIVKIPLIIGPDTWITGDHGVASGSNWTNDVETYLDLIAEIYFMLRGLVLYESTAIGDDVQHVTGEFDPRFADKIAYLYRRMGFDVNAEKVTNERDWVKYLQRLFVRGYYVERDAKDKKGGPLELRGIYSTIRALNSSLNPEKFHKPEDWNKDMFAVRQFSILENCVDHPLFKEFVEFICAGNNYLVEFARKTREHIDEQQRLSHHLPGLNPTYNQEKRDRPMSEYASIRIARTL